MNTQLSEENIEAYAFEAQSTQAPTGADFSQGVQVGKTIPAKWWNWLFNAVINRKIQAKADSQNMLTELQNAVVDAGIELDDNTHTQLLSAVGNKNKTQLSSFIEQVKRNVYGRWFVYSAIVKRYNSAGTFISAQIQVLRNLIMVDNGLLAAGISQAVSLSFDGENWTDLALYGAIMVTAPIILLNVSDTTLQAISTQDWVIEHRLTVVDSIPLPAGSTTRAHRQAAWFTIINGVYYCMLFNGAFVSFDGQHLTDTGITAADLNIHNIDELPNASQSYLGAYANSEFSIGAKIEPVRFANKYYVGNLAFDGTTWTNANPLITNRYEANPLLSYPRVLRANKLVFIPCVDSTSYIISEDGSSVLSEISFCAYHRQHQVEDIAVTISNNLIAYSYDGITVTEIPSSNVDIYFSYQHIIQVGEQYIVHEQGHSAIFNKNFVRRHEISRPIGCRLEGTVC